MPETHVYVVVVVHIFMRRYHGKMGLTRFFLIVPSYFDDFSK